MSAAILLLATVPAYLVAGIVLLSGGSWGLALAVLSGTGLAMALVIGALVARHRPACSRPPGLIVLET